MTPRESTQPVVRRAGPGQAVPSERGTLEFVDRMSDVLGERASVALLRYAAEATVLARMDGPRVDKAQREDVLSVASGVALSELRAVLQTSDRLEVESVPGPAYDGVRSTLVNALCLGAVEGAFKSMYHPASVSGEIVAQTDGRLMINVWRG